ACHPVSDGSRVGARSGRTYSQAAPGPPQSHLTEPPTSKSTPSAVTSSGTVPTDWYASSTTSAPSSCALATIASTSWICPVLKSTCVIGTSSVRSSIASTTPSSSAATSTSAPRAAWYR